MDVQNYRTSQYIPQSWKLVEKKIFKSPSSPYIKSISEKILMSAVEVSRCALAEKFHQKTFTNGQQNVKFMNVFCLANFPLHGTILQDKSIQRRLLSAAVGTTECTIRILRMFGDDFNLAILASITKFNVHQ